MKRFLISIAAVLACLTLAAQGINTEVQVTNEYQTRLDDVAKQGPQMLIPDSLRHFDYHFDYSVFDSPYKGAYEFSPYSVAITPEPRTYDGRRLYLSAGAGYTLRPELDVVWAAVDNKNLAVNVFGTGNGYYGKYRNVVPGSFVVEDGKFSNGWDFSAAGGVDTRFRIGKVGLRAILGYDGIFTGHELYRNGNCHAPGAQLSFAYDTGAMFSYSGGATYRYVNDWISGLGPMQDHEVKADASVNVRFREGYTVGTDLTFVYNTFYTAGNVHPHAMFSVGAFDFDAGFRIGWVADSFSIRPDVTAKVRVLKDYLRIYAGAVGQDHYTTYWDYKTLAHRYQVSYSQPRAVKEIADLYLGLGGHGDFGLQYDLRAGYRFLQDSPFWTISNDGLESLSFQDCGLFHADLALSWVSERINFDGGVHLVMLPEGVPEGVFEPSLVYGNMKGGYNWNKRIYVGLSIDGATGRNAVSGTETVSLPGYIDLGVWAEYRFTGSLSVWLKGKNLLNQDIRVSPLISEAGQSVIAGVSLSL